MLKFLIVCIKVANTIYKGIEEIPCFLRRNWECPQNQSGNFF